MPKKKGYGKEKHMMPDMPPKKMPPKKMPKHR